MNIAELVDGLIPVGVRLLELRVRVEAIHASPEVIEWLAVAAKVALGVGH